MLKTLLRNAVDEGNEQKARYVTEIIAAINLEQKLAPNEYFNDLPNRRQLEHLYKDCLNRRIMLNDESRLHREMLTTPYNEQYPLPSCVLNTSNCIHLCRGRKCEGLKFNGKCVYRAWHDSYKRGYKRIFPTIYDQRN